MTGLIDIWGVDGGPQPVAENIAVTSTNSQQPAYDETEAAVLAMTKEHVPHAIPLLEDRRGGIELMTPYLFIHGTADQTYAYEKVILTSCEDKTNQIPWHSRLLKMRSSQEGHARYGKAPEVKSKEDIVCAI